MTVLRLPFERLPDTVFFILMVRIVDGTPLVLLEKDERHSETMKKMSVQDEDIMAMARDNRLKRLDQLDYAVLERNGGISIIEAETFSPVPLAHDEDR